MTKIRADQLPKDLMDRMIDGDKVPPTFTFDGATGAIDELLAIDTRCAAAVHDHHYSQYGYPADRKAADRILYRNLRISDVGKIRAMAWYVAVRLMGWRHFRYVRPLDRRREMLVSAFWLFVLVAAIVAASWWLGR